MSDRGLTRERRLRRALEPEWTTFRCAKGPVDLILIHPHHDVLGPTGKDLGESPTGGSDVRLVQVKSTAGGPYERFGPADREELLMLAQACRATAWLIWWPPKRGWKWIPSDQWPKARK
jgi:hypothetical protein